MCNNLFFILFFVSMCLLVCYILTINWDDVVLDQTHSNFQHLGSEFTRIVPIRVKTIPQHSKPLSKSREQPYVSLKHVILGTTS